MGKWAKRRPVLSESQLVVEKWARRRPVLIEFELVVEKWARRRELYANRVHERSLDRAQEALFMMNGL